MNQKLGAVLALASLAALSVATPASAACAGRTIRGNAGANTINGTCGPDKIYGMGGNDNLKGLGGNDRIFGGEGNDTIDGGPGNDILKGEGGHDNLKGNAGGDTINGGPGRNGASYAGSPSGVTVNLQPSPDTASGGHATGDKLSSILSLTGSSFADSLTSPPPGRASYLVGSAGADTLQGDFSTVLDYRTSPQSIEINLDDTNPETGGHAQGDVIPNHVVSILGTPGDDEMKGDLLFQSGTLVGGGGADVLTAGWNASLIGDGATWAFGSDPEIPILMGTQGEDSLFINDGNSTVIGGPAGDHFQDNGTDRGDRLDYSDSTEAVTVNLLLGTGFGGHAAGDTIELGGFETVLGSQLGDTLTGDAERNVVAGLGGDDDVYGGAGNDDVTGDSGNDNLFGGDGSDTLYPGPGNDSVDGGAHPVFSTINEFEGDQVWYASALQGVSVSLRVGFGHGEGHDDITGIESVFGSSFDDVLEGDSGMNYLIGSSADDRLYGNEGDDWLDGVDGFDRAYGGEGGETEGDKCDRVDIMTDCEVFDT